MSFLKEVMFVEKTSVRTFENKMSLRSLLSLALKIKGKLNSWFCFFSVFFVEVFEKNRVFQPPNEKNSVVICALLAIVFSTACEKRRWRDFPIICFAKGNAFKTTNAKLVWIRQKA